MRVIRSAGQNVSPSDDGRLFDQAFTDGLFEDATIVANGGNTISLSALYGIICGRDFTAEAQTISAVLPQTDTATGYVYVEFDTSSDDIITIGTALAPFTPTYENINTNGAVVQMVIAEYTASAVAVTSVTPTYVKASAGGVGSLAMIEASPATANHAVGTYLVYNGILYSVTSAIAIGETLVVGTNIAEAKVGDALSELKSGLTSLVHDAISSAPLAVNGTYQIPTAILNHKIVILILRRYGHIGSAVLLSENIRAGVATEGSTIYPFTGVNYTYTINGTGLLKLTAMTGNVEPYIQVVGIL